MIATRTYQEFLQAKSQLGGEYGFEPLWMPDWLFDFQASLDDWSIRKGRAAILAGCGLGKTPMQLVWAKNVVLKENKPVLIGSPLAVAEQTASEAEKFGIECFRSKDGRFGTNKIVVTNYERLHHFDPSDFCAFIADESQITKNFEGATKAAITEFMRRMKYRLLCSATPAPNDYTELGTSSEALGGLGYMEMLQTFFVNDQHSLHPSKHGKFNDAWYGEKWFFKPHAERQFWRWMCSWARAIRKPSDLGFDDGRFILPPLTVNKTIVNASRPTGGRLFVTPAKGLSEQRQERRHTINARCECAAGKVEGKDPAVVWCHLNPEGDLLTKLIPGAVQVSGRDSDDEKEEKFLAFQSGEARVLVTKPKIGALGLNWQHCNRMTFFPSHSFEQWYQAIRRCWRFGQTRPVTVDVVTTEGESDVMENLQRKADAAERMFAMLVAEMGSELSVRRDVSYPNPVKVPQWL